MVSMSTLKTRTEQDELTSTSCWMVQYGSASVQLLRFAGLRINLGSCLCQEERRKNLVVLSFGRVVAVANCGGRKQGLLLRPPQAMKENH